MTIGIDAVALRAASVAAMPEATMTSTRRRASSAARSGKRSSRPSAQRYSSVTVRPGIQPSWVRPATNASEMCLAAAGVVDIKIPTDGTLAGDWPSAAAGSRARTQREGERPHPERPAGGTSRRSIDLVRQRAISSRQAR